MPREPEIMAKIIKHDLSGPTEFPMTDRLKRVMALMKVKHERYRTIILERRMPVIWNWGDAPPPTSMTINQCTFMPCCMGRDEVGFQGLAFMDAESEANYAEWWAEEQAHEKLTPHPTPL